MLRFLRISLAAALFLFLQPVTRPTLAAQSSAFVRVTVQTPRGPALGAMVRSDTVSRTADRRGLATLPLGTGRHTLVATQIGWRPDSMALVLHEGQDTSITLVLEEELVQLEEVTVSTTRSERRIEDQPLRVEMLGREEVEEKLLMTPGDISMLLNETGGMRVQNTSPSLGGANVRIQGLRGRYSLLLSDGLPLYGGQSGSLGLLQVPPMDLGQVEIIKGAASALYGSSALGGVINLLSRKPDGSRAPAGRTTLVVRTRCRPPAASTSNGATPSLEWPPPGAGRPGRGRLE